MDEIWSELESESTKVTVSTDNPEWDVHAKFAEDWIRDYQERNPSDSVSSRLKLIDVIYDEERKKLNLLVEEV